MNTRERACIQAVIDNEGFDYGFIHYTNFDNVKDAKFHELRKAFVDAREKLRDYLKGQIDLEG